MTKIQIDEIVAVHVAELFRALGDVSRIQIVSALIDNEINVGELAKIAGISESAASHQLRTLRQMRLVKSRKKGREVFYSIDDDHIRDLIQRAISHVAHE
ncbi:MAG: helix-turn-helix transcriptional regulator [Anaerolineae bacterium]|mgnify:FL=1|jgi:ArsR family transcriptional regulator, lead/cadmium/zinc/bismuth-responsive transcriptional repressor|nr:helix-turn-helix transcriptional regulator [Anaerolineae bacterium]MBT7599715.1 helix-turn-helix transcriptional regulator [Anaerolineae bacterium]MBT7988338.1 helix-turn-helix transcriptional regulator [Anaerolineae bacterium]